MYTLFFDSDCDVTLEDCAEVGAKMISMPVCIDGKDVYPYVDWKVFDQKKFYDMLRTTKNLPTTSALSPEDYKKYFEPEFKAGRDVLYIHFSAAMSATFNSLRLAMEDLKELYPNCRLELIDTKGITLGSYALCKQMGKLYKEGKSIEEIKAWADENVDKQAFYFYADNLKFFAKSGRVAGFAAFMGGIIGIRPMIYIGSDGKMTSCGKAKGRKGAVAKLLEYVVSLEDHIKDYPVVIAHTDALEMAEEFADTLRKQFGDDLNIEIIPVNPTAGAHCGPDAIGVTFHAKHR